MLTDTDYSMKNNSSVDRAIYLIAIVSNYISKKNSIIFIYNCRFNTSCCKLSITAHDMGDQPLDMGGVRKRGVI